MSVRVAKAILVFCAAGFVVFFSLIATAAAGAIAGSTGATPPTSYLVLFWTLCAVLGAIAGWGVSRLEALR